MTNFKLHTPATTSIIAAGHLKDVTEQLGFLPNVFAVAAGASPVLAAFVTLNEQFAQTSLSALEREIVHTATSVKNKAPYCVAGHTAFVDMLNLDQTSIDAIRANEDVSDPKLEALRVFTENLVQKRGEVSADEVRIFLDAGYSHDQVLEVILGVTVKVFTNFTSKVTDIPLDEPFSAFAWTA